MHTFEYGQPLPYGPGRRARVPSAVLPRCGRCGRPPGPAAGLAGPYAAGGSGCLGARLSEGEPLATEVGDDLQSAAEGFDVGGQGAQFRRAGPGVLDGGDAALGNAHAGGYVGLGDAEAAAHLARRAPRNAGSILTSPARKANPSAGPNASRCGTA